MGKTKEKTEAITFYNRQKAGMQKLGTSSKSPIVQAVDILAAMGTDTITILPDKMTVSDGDTGIIVMMGLGITARVNRNEFKKTIKHINGEFVTTLDGNLIIFDWGDGNSVSMEVEDLANEPHVPGKGYGKETALFESNDFYQALVGGGSAVSDSMLGRLSRIHYDGTHVCSTDNKMLCISEYGVGQADTTDGQYPGFMLSAKAFALWKHRSLNLPTKYICVYEHGVKIMIQDHIIICSKGLEGAQINQAVIDKAQHMKQYVGRKFKIPDDLWKKLKMFKGCKELTIKNNEIVVEGSRNLNVKTNMVPFETNEESFTVITDELFRLKPLITSMSDCSILQMDQGPHVNKYLYIEIDPGMSDIVVLGGIAEEKE